MWINDMFTPYLQSNYSTDDNKNRHNGFGEHLYLIIGSAKIRFLGYTPETFSQWLYAALWGLTNFDTL